MNEVIKSTYGFQPPFSGMKGKYRRWTLKEFSKKPGVYIIKEDGLVVYVGRSAKNVAKAMYNHFCQWPPDRQRVHSRVTYLDMVNHTYEVQIIQVTAEEAVKIERGIIVSLQPRDNTDKFEHYVSEIHSEIFRKEEAVNDYGDFEPVEDDDLPY